MTHDEALEIIERTLEKIGEHFEAVQILASWSEDGNTSIVNRGAGNFYARVGMAHSFIERDKAEDHANKLGQVINPPDDDWKQPH